MSSSNSSQITVLGKHMAVIRLSTVENGKQINCQSLVIGLLLNVNVVTALIQMYSFNGCVLDARKLFDGVSSRDVAFQNSMVAGYAKVGDMDRAWELLERMPESNVISWTTVIAGYTQMNCPDKAIMVFQRMQLEGVEPDGISGGKKEKHSHLIIFDKLIEDKKIEKH
ncbi:pentatricopeptide repeat-containing protein At5g56310-like [Tripterygium wilfordii]|uniref:pentatricopeptide repeat-containing protein At5g56310-like n=1 Tax=Tripterygium wilfordii TaxID=458696 RepID=UPI0018F81CF6|nr:pentatricopeptide repeat-containing protein At5g56310-like [Tripterygium wilfordii]